MFRKILKCVAEFVGPKPKRGRFSDGRMWEITGRGATRLVLEDETTRKVIAKQMESFPDPTRADEVRIYYMHDNHTFTRLCGTTIDEVIESAEAMAVQDRCGSLCPPIILAGGKEVRRLNAMAHAPCGRNDTVWRAGLAAWRAECEADSDVMRLVSSSSYS